MITRYFPFTLTLGAPLLATDLGGDPNSATSMQHIPGSAIRGAVARAAGNNATLLRELVLSGAVRYLNAYPVESNERALPSPRSLRSVKGKQPSRDGSVSLYDLAAFSRVPDEEHDTEGIWPEEDLASDVPAFLVRVGGQMQPADVRMSSRVHQQRDRSKGHAWKRGEEAQGTIFSYEAIEPGQVFRGIVLVEGGDDAEVTERFERVRERLPDPLLLGRSRRAGYGGDAVVVWGRARPREVEDWPVIANDVPAGETFRALLTAPYVGRDQRTGQSDPAALGPELLERLGNRDERVRCKLVAVRGADGVVGGYNRTWGLPLPQAPTMATGTVVVLEANEPVPFRDLVAIEHAGLGERRTEGFGRVCFLQPAYKRVLIQRPQARAKRPNSTPPALITQIQERLLQDRLDRELTTRAAQLAKSASQRPSTALIGRLRTALRREPGSAVRTLTDWLGDGEGALRPPAMRQLERCRITPNGSTTTLRDWLRRGPEARQLGQLLRFDAIAQSTAFDVAQPSRAALDSQAQAIWLRLVDTTLEVMARRNRAQEGAHDGQR